MSSSLSTSTENSVDSMPRGGNLYYSSQLQQQQQYHYQMNQPLNYNNNNNNNNIHHQSHNQNGNNTSYSTASYNNSLNNYQHQQIHHQQQQQQHHHHQHYQHPSISTVFPSIYAESMMNSSNGNNQIESNNIVSGLAGSNSSMISGTGSVSANSGSNVQANVVAANGANLMGNHYSSVQKQIQQDWSNREYIEVIISNIKKLTDFLNSFELSCKSKLAMLDEKLTKLERQIDFVEAKVTKGETLN